MSEPVQDKVLRDLTRSLAKSGSTWGARIKPEQRDLVRTLSHMQDNGDSRLWLSSAANWMATGYPGARGRFRWNYKAADVRVFGPGRWGYRVTSYPAEGGVKRWSTVDLSGYDAEYHVNDGGEEAIVVSEEGCVIRLAPGYYADSDLGDGLLVVDTGGGESFLIVNGSYLEIEEPSDGIEVVQSLESVWLFRIAPDIRPVALDTTEGILFEGPGFRWTPGYLLLRHNPSRLWPDGIAQVLDHEWLPACPRHHALRTDTMRGPGNLVADYLRHTQDTGSLLKACAEVAGLRVFDGDLVIQWIDHHCGTTRHYLSDNTSFDLKGPSPYSNGSVVHEGEVAGNRLALRCRRKQGEAWFANRPWGVGGFDSSLVWPAFPGLKIRDEFLSAESYDDGGATRARIVFNQDSTLEEALWAWQASCERRTGTNWALDVFGFTAPGQNKTVNPLEVLLGIAGSWALAVEGDLALHDEPAWKEVLDFLDREKPAGSLLVPGAFPAEATIFGSGSV